MAFKEFYRIITLVMVIFLTACAPGPRTPDLHQVFPPSPLLPLNIAISSPIVAPSHGPGHEALASWDESPGKRRLLMRCAWQEGLKIMTESMIPGTEITFLGEGRNPLAAVGPGVQAEMDSLGNVHFFQANQSTIDLARHRQWTHLVVPYDLQYLFNDDGDDFILKSPVAIVDVLEQRIVWQGTVSSEQIALKTLGGDDSTRPELTNYEGATYRFVLSLAEIMDRSLNPLPQSRHHWALPCQDRIPLLHQEN